MKGILIDPCVPKATMLLLISLRASSTIRKVCVPSGGTEGSIFTKRCFPDRLKGFREISYQMKGLPLKNGVLYNIPRGSSEEDLSHREVAVDITIMYTDSSFVQPRALSGNFQSVSSKAGQSLPLLTTSS